MTIKDEAEQMLRVLPGPGQWMRCGFSSGSRRCLIGAYAQATGDIAMDLVWGRTPSRCEEIPYLQLLAGIIREQYAERVALCEDVTNTIMGFNDSACTRYADVRVVLEKALVRAQEQEE
jgi:hypothetical protein